MSEVDIDNPPIANDFYQRPLTITFNILACQINLWYAWHDLPCFSMEIQKDHNYHKCSIDFSSIASYWQRSGKMLRFLYLLERIITKI